MTRHRHRHLAPQGFGSPPSWVWLLLALPTVSGSGTLSPSSPTPPSLPPLPPAPLASTLAAPNALCDTTLDQTAHGGPSGFNQSSCLAAAAAALRPCFSLFPAAGACYVCESCANRTVFGFELYYATWHYSPPPPTPPPSSPPAPPVAPPPMPPAPVGASLIADDALCVDALPLAAHGGPSG